MYLTNLKKASCPDRREGQALFMSDISIYPLEFDHIFKTVIWGGTRIAEFKRVQSTADNIGESWEISGIRDKESTITNGAFAGKKLSEAIDVLKGDLIGEHIFNAYGNQFPLLIKFIDAYQNLSLQVHPDNEMAEKYHNTYGKTEMWYVLESADHAKIYSGFNRDLSPEEYEKCIADNTIIDAVNCCESTPGDLFYLPPGRIHAIGSGNFLIEIQRTCDITYRVYDYNRKDKDGNTRELHTERAKEALDFTRTPNSKTDYQLKKQGISDLISCEYFQSQLAVVDGVQHFDYAQADSFKILICTEGEATVTCDNGTSCRIRQGKTILIPAAIKSFDIEGRTTLLTVTA